MNQIIIHIDMDAFFASVEIRDNNKLYGKPLIIGALPNERGVVSTCSYEARKYGIRSGMNIKEAYRLCPNGIYMHTNMHKYKDISNQIHGIWNEYASITEAVALDEAYLDVTEQANTFSEARRIAQIIKQRIKEETGLTCSVGVAYSKTAAKIASEENKPNGYFEIQSPEDFINLIIDRDIKILHSIGNKTAKKLYNYGINTIRDIQNNQDTVIRLLGKQGQWVTQIAKGIDDRKVTTHLPQDAKSISREITFQEDVDDYQFLKDVLLLLAISVEKRTKRYGLHGNGVSLKISYPNMKSITRSKSISNCESAIIIYKEAVKMLDTIEKKPIRLIGTGVYNISNEEWRQITLDDLFTENNKLQNDEIELLLETLQNKYKIDLSNQLNLNKQEDMLHSTIEYMRKHRIINDA